MSTVTNLFNSNSLSLDKFFVYRLQIDNSGSKHVRCYQYVNDVQVFSDEVIFHFNNLDRYTIHSGEIISEIDISNRPTMSKTEVMKLFFKIVDEDGNYSSQQLDNDCYKCEIGYYDINAGTGNLTHNFKLAWKIRRETSDFPFAYINDTDKLKIYYDTGVRY